jgi:hypothetical protein
VRRRLASALAVLLLAAGCASRGGRAFAPATAEGAAAARQAWQRAAARAPARLDANLLYDASLSGKLLRTDGTLAVRLRGDRVEGTLAGPFGTPIATYANGELSGEKLRPVRLPPGQLRAVLAGTWDADDPAVAGENGTEVLLRWAGEESAEGVFDVGREELLSLRIDRPEGGLEARFSGTRGPWPDRIEIDEKGTGVHLRLKLLSREAAP